MRKYKVKLFLLSILLLTFVSGIFFYRNLFFKEINVLSRPINYEELKNRDQKLNFLLIKFRKNLTDPHDEIATEISTIKDHLDIIRQAAESTPKLKVSIQRISDYFSRKFEVVNDIQKNAQTLRSSLLDLNKNYYSIQKANLRFIVDKREVYQDSIIDSLNYTIIPNKENKSRVEEDLKIINQVISFSNKPNLLIANYAKIIETILQTTEKLELLTDYYKDQSLSQETAIVEKYLQELQQNKTGDQKNYLIIIFSAIILYILIGTMILKKI